MVVANLIGRVPVLIGSILFAVLGVVLIIVGATASPTGTGRIIIGVVLIVGAALLALDALSDRSRRQSAS